MSKALFVVLVFSFLVSCQTDAEQVAKSTNTEKKSAKPAKKRVEKPTKSDFQADAQERPSVPIDRSKSNQKIDHNRIDLNLLTSLMHEEINKARRANSLGSLRNHDILRRAATNQNDYQIRNGDLTHTQSTRGMRELKDRVRHFGGGFQSMGENLIYEGFTVRTINGTRQEIITPTYKEIVKTMVVNWMNSPGHRKNILEAEFQQVGTAIKYNPKNHAIYATQVFGRLL